ncbi:sortase-dependent protein [Streptomyces collinus]|uniref:sortase-dependent protein n=1 Tax=Streptomyces collinus TaxID=42684 RepID=UPI0033EC7831
MRRTVLSALALAGTAVLMGTGPAFADGPTTPSPVPASAAPTTHPEQSAEPTRAAEPTPAPASDEPTRAPAEGQVSRVPSGAPDTGVAASPASGNDGTALGAGAAGVLALGGGTVFVVRRRRATGA